MESHPEALVRCVLALIEQDADVADSFLQASVYVVAMQRDTSPQDVCDSLFKSVPTGDAWPELREALIAVAGEE